MRFRLRTLLIVLAVGPPLLCVVWTKYEAWRIESESEWHWRAHELIAIEPASLDEN